MNGSTKILVIEKVAQLMLETQISVSFTFYQCFWFLSENRYQNDTSSMKILPHYPFQSPLFNACRPM